MAGHEIGVLEILERSRGYDTALLTTFNFEIDFFEKAILSRLLKNSIKKISLFVDAKELAKAVSDAHSPAIGQRYVVNPVFMHGSYHPKMILLLGEKKARLIVGSGNLKTSGYCINNEIFDCIDYDTNNTETRGAIVDAIHFFMFSNTLTPGVDTELLNDVAGRVYYRPAPLNDDIRLIENSSIPILTQVKNAITQTVKSIRVAVPYYDNELKGLSAIREAFPEASIELYLQRERSTYPTGIMDEGDAELRIFEKVHVPDNPNNHFYHGKVFLFETDSYDHILYGSSNCTQSAILKTAKDGGNVECDLLSRGKAGDYQSFFSCFCLSDSQDPESHLLKYVPDKQNNFYFRFGILEASLELHLAYTKEPADINLTFKGGPVEWRRSQGEIIASIELERVDDTIIELEVSYDGAVEKVLCWYIDRMSIDLFRISLPSSEGLADTPDFGKGEKFWEDYEKILRAIDPCNEDYIQNQLRLQPYLSSIRENDESDLEDAPDSSDFIVNVTLTDDDYLAYKQYKVMERLRDRIKTRYLKGVAWFFSSDRYRAMPYDVGIPDINESSVIRLPSSEEKRFAGFIKRTVRNAQDDPAIEKISVDHYTGLITTILDVFDKYRDTDGMFQKTYVIKSRCDLMIKLLQKIEVTHPDFNAVISRFLGTLLDNHLICNEFEDFSQRSKYERENRNVLMLLEDKLHLRNNYSDYFVLDEKLSPDDSIERIKKAREYVDGLYGYQDLGSIENRLQNRHGDMCEVTVEDSTAKILILSDRPSDFFKPDIALLKDLKMYSINVKKISKVIIEIENLQPQDPNAIVMVRHIINMDHKWSYRIVRQDGRKQEQPSQFIPF